MLMALSRRVNVMKNCARMLGIAALPAGLILTHAPVAAQVEGVDWGGLMEGIAFGTAMDEAARETVTKQRPKQRSASSGGANHVAGLGFRPSLDRRRQNLAQFVAKTRARDPKGAAELEQLFASGDIIARINQQLAGYGFKPDDLASAYAAWWMNAWLAAHGRTEDPSRTQVLAVSAQAARALSNLPQVTGASDAAKQEMAEAYLVQALLIGAMLDHAKGNPDQLQKVAAATREGARASGLDLGAMTLTDQGFVPAKESGLSGGAAPGVPAHGRGQAAASAGPAGNVGTYAVAGIVLASAAVGAYALGARGSRRPD